MTAEKKKRKNWLLHHFSNRKILIPISVKIWWQPDWAAHDTISKGVSRTHQSLIKKNLNQPSYSSIKIVNPVFHNHSTCTTKFMVTHQSPENIIICNMHLPALTYSQSVINRSSPAKPKTHIYLKLHTHKKIWEVYTCMARQIIYNQWHSYVMPIVIISKKPWI